MLKYTYNNMRIDGFMHTRKKLGFTLSEALISLTIVGVVAALAVPIVLKDTINKARITNLKSTVAQLNDAIQIEIEKTGATSLSDTKLVKAPTSFFQNLDYVKEVYAGEDEVYEEDFNYKSLSGSNRGLPSMESVVKLKNGAIVGFMGSQINLTEEEGDSPNEHYMYIDANGLKGPNVFGIDMFALYLIDRTDTENNLHIGDLGCKADVINITYGNCKNANSTPNQLACYCLLERSGFDPNYMNNY